MSRQIVTALIFSLTLLAGACSNESAFEPSQPTLSGNDQQGPSFNGGVADDPKPKGSPGGSRGGWKK